MTLSKLYQSQIKARSIKERLQIAQWILADLANAQVADRSDEPSQRSLLDLQGLGAEIWEGVDAQAYVSGLRSEWDHRP